MEVVMMAVDAVRPYEGNPRKNDHAVAAAAESIRLFGWRQPIVVDAGMVIVVGETRWKAARALGHQAVPVHVAGDLTPEQARRYRIADNKVGELAEWDDEKLWAELRADIDAGGDPADWLSLGFVEGEIEELLIEPGQTGPDDLPEPSEIVTAVLGDLWVLGEHRLLCGDSTSADDVARLLGDDRPAICSTDPPYLVDYTGLRGGDRGKDWTDKYREIDIKDATGFYRSVFTNVLAHLAEHGAIYCWHAHRRLVELLAVWEELGILDHQQIVWVKPASVFGRVFWHFRHEMALMGWRKGSMPPHDGRYEFNSVWACGGTERALADMSREELLALLEATSSAWEIDFEGKARSVGAEHPTQKPVEIFARPIRKHSKIGDVVYEPFSGSGSQLIAAEMLGRRCRAMELSPPFVDVAVRRWQHFTGREAVLEGDGSTWAAVRKKRRDAERRRAKKVAARGDAE